MGICAQLVEAQFEWLYAKFDSPAFNTLGKEKAPAVRCRWTTTWSVPASIIGSAVRWSRDTDCSNSDDSKSPGSDRGFFTSAAVD